MLVVNVHATCTCHMLHVVTCYVQDEVSEGSVIDQSLLHTEWVLSTEPLDVGPTRGGGREGGREGGHSSVCLAIKQSTPSVCLAIKQSTLSVSLAIKQSTLSVCLTVSLAIKQSTLSVCLSVCLSVISTFVRPIFRCIVPALASRHSADQRS